MCWTRDARVQQMAPTFGGRVRTPIFHGNHDYSVEDASILSVGISWALPGRHFGQVVKSWNFGTSRHDLRIQ